MPEFCEVAIEKLVQALTGWAELEADFEKSQHECYMHGDDHACNRATHINDQLAKEFELIGKLTDDMKHCMRRLPVPVGQVRR